MSERKVINKYYPPDFDPAKIPRGRKSKNGQVTVRMMLPMSVRCNLCGEYLYKGKKFNSKKETVHGEEYLGVKIFRFYMKCTNCSAEFTIKTDPQNSDYIAEGNCSRNFEPWRENQKFVEEAKKAREKEEEGDAMKALENRTMDSKIEMDIIEALDEIRALNARNAQITSDKLLEIHKRTYEQMQSNLEQEDDELVKTVIFKNSNNFLKRLEDEEEQEPIRVKKNKAESSDFIKVLPLPEKKVIPKQKIGAVKLVATNSNIKKGKEMEKPAFSLVDYASD